MTTDVLFLCTGNICRSPLAEVMARAIFDDAVRVSSAGTHAVADAGASSHAVTVAAERGLDLADHRARPLVGCSQPDLVFGMEQHHLVAARRQFPDLDIDRIRLLDHPRGITDPYGRDIDAYRRAADAIERALANLDEGSFS